MLSLFRRVLGSRVGIVLAGLLLAVIAVGFAMTDVGNVLSGSGARAGGGDRLVRIGKDAIYAADVRDAMEARLDEARQQNPTLDMAGFIAEGGFESTLDGMILQRSIDSFGRKNGLRAGKKMVDGEIASIPAFFGPTGKFDRSVFVRLLNDRNITEQQMRDDIARVLVSRQMIGPAVANASVPTQLALPYASLQLETRDGTLGTIPSGAMDQGPAPTAAELDAYYKRNIRIFTVPERRVVRFAPFSPKLFTDIKATDAEIAKAYEARKAEFAAKETRDFIQVILPTREAAQALAAKVRTGTAMGDAAVAVKLEASSTGSIDKATLAGMSSAAVANAAFAAPKDGVTDPVQSGLGWHVVKVGAIITTPARTIEQVRGELVTQVENEKVQAAVADLHAKIEDAINDGASFDEIVAANKLQVTTTPKLMANGVDPDNPQEIPPPALAELLRPAFDGDVDDDPSVLPVGPAEAQSFVLMDLVEIVPAAAKPLAEIKPMVTEAFLLDRRSQAARKAALDVIAKVNKGMDVEQALREIGRPLPPTRKIGGQRMAVMRGAQQGQRAQPTDVLLFSMAQGKIKLLEIPNKQGWYVVYLKTIVPGDASKNDQLLLAARQGFGQAAGGEYAEQLGAAMRAAIGVTRDEAAIAKLKAELAGDPAGR